MADDNGKQGWAPATYLEPLVASNNDDMGYDWVSVIDENGYGELACRIRMFLLCNSANTPIFLRQLLVFLYLMNMR